VSKGPATLLEKDHIENVRSRTEKDLVHGRWGAVVEKKEARIKAITHGGQSGSERRGGFALRESGKKDG